MDLLNRIPVLGAAPALSLPIVHFVKSLRLLLLCVLGAYGYDVGMVLG